MNNEEAHLIRQAKSGDPQAFSELYRRYQPKVYRYVAFRVADVPTAEDLTSEVFVRLVENIDRFRDTGRPILAWLYTIARNLVTDHYRREGRATHIPLRDSLEADSGDPVRHTQRSLEQERVVTAMQMLTEEQRQVILLKFYEETDNATAADVLGKTVGAIKALQHRALAALGRALAPPDGDHK